MNINNPNKNSNKKQLNDMKIAYNPLPNSKKIYTQGTQYPDIKVPHREISLHPTVTDLGNQENKPVNVYDTSGP